VQSPAARPQDQAAISQVLDTMSLTELTSADVPELLSIKA